MATDAMLVVVVHSQRVNGKVYFSTSNLEDEG